MGNRRYCSICGDHGSKNFIKSFWCNDTAVGYCVHNSSCKKKAKEKIRKMRREAAAEARREQT
jgi:hypothetical protein